MNNIENVYTNYDQLLKEFGEEKIRFRFQQILEEMNAFLVETDLREKTRVDELLLMHAVLDYFSDISRLKNYQEIDRVNEIKIKAYETFWLLQRKPIQFLVELENDTMLYINEKFILARLFSYLLKNDMTKPLLFEKNKALKNFLDTFYYFMKFRRCDAQAIELMILAYNAGRLMAE